MLTFTILDEWAQPLKMLTITNIAAYKFAALTNLKPFREQLLAHCKKTGLKGTILLSTEGINLFVAGRQTEIDLLLMELRSQPGLESLEVKVSESDHQPFSRMLVKIKREIIAFGVEGIDPARYPSPKLAPRELKRWLDEGRPITLLDTRNDYEVKLGTFKNSISLGIDQFRKFPAAVQHLSTEMKQQPIVMFCTGGIRCEKAGPFMEREGFEKIFQLDGGILKYFEECGSAHYEGECFVFDQRVGVDPTLQETSSNQCFACLTPLQPEELRDPRYVPGKSCAYCYMSTEEQATRAIAARQEAIRSATTPLPGSQSYENHRPVTIPSTFDGQTILDCLAGIFDHISRQEWLIRFEKNWLLNSAYQPVGPRHRVRTGERYLQRQPGTIEPDVNVDIQILYEDEAIIVLQKPAPLPMHPCGRFNRNTLQHILSQVYRPHNPKAAHRLDANTSGIVLFSRTKHVAGMLQPQFERGEIAKVYLARVQGHPQEETFCSTAPISVKSADLGSRAIDELNGLPSRTDFRVLNRFSDQTTLLEVIPFTGRTNQIRVHLWDYGIPIVNDPTYLSGGRLGETQTCEVTAPPLRLLAHRLSFTHPLTRQRMTFETGLPEWIQ
ncbi:MAG: sulfurtransferase [Planctomycetales bacterium]|nr:sulfurtransferase [Planctomycetales bacterium]